MASGSKHPPGRGGNGSADPKVRRTLSRKPTMLNVPQEEEATLLADSELVPILRVANEIETFSPRVAHLCQAMVGWQLLQFAHCDRLQPT
ncbi:1,3-beta-glucan synthase component [Musa troglodytarum]|uniref:1,3-beta-glucan synthase component n=1 Tax=Musa troglodytarum TaxID=320322 RepID=A0A9E7FVW5_9LILI|nr:1,3-beta-glucan synthase component [Musa troglodytarum]URE03283.1 1,3-beta-glucan synthase component [Musa troglodytarum]URE03292.1 1,3-beta-glucan synthase component [Musa troglodytarum]